MRIKLRTQLAAIFTIFSLAGIIFFYFYTIQLQRKNFRSDFDKRIEQFVDTIKLGIEVGLSEENFATIQKVFEWARKESTVQWVVLLDEDGKLFAKFPDDFQITDENLKEFVSPETKSALISGIVRTTKWKSPILKGSMYINFSTSELLNREQELLRVTAKTSIVAMLVIIFAVWILASIITRPLERLQKITQLISKGDLSIRFQDIKMDSQEISSVGKYFNEMMQNLEEFNQSLQLERAKSEKLLYNILPTQIAERLKKGEQSIADHYDRASVMFIDLVGFTDLASRITPHELIEVLNTIFFAFDELITQHGVEKIKTIGDSYMIVGGLTGQDPQTDSMVDLAFDMQKCLEKISCESNYGLAMRTGIHVGPVVAGVIGKNKYVYDIWGDSVNVASRMEARGEAGKVHITAEGIQLLQKKYLYSDRGEIEVKGKGLIHTFFISKENEIQIPNPA